MTVSGVEIYNLVAQLATELGFADFGCARASEIPEETRLRYLKALGKGNFAGMDYLGRNIDKRFNPKLLVEGAESMLVFLAPYSLPKGETPPNGIAQFALGYDYHNVIKEKLFCIMKRISEVLPSFNGRAFTDSAPVLERYWAVEAGLGWIGKNNFLISKKCGIKNLIGVIVCNAIIPTTLEMEPGKISENTGSCAECSRCMDSCPTKALEMPFSTDARKCISYHTIENRNLQADMDAGLVPHFKGVIFGCDRCLDACPWNRANKIGWNELHKNAAILREKENDWWEGLGNIEFKKTFKGTSLLRGGLDNIKMSLEWGKMEKHNG